MSDQPAVLSCTAPRDKTMSGIGGPRCAAPATHRTIVGTFCDACLIHIKKNYDSSLLKLLRDQFQGVKPKEEA